MPKKKPNVWVIFARPRSQGPGPNLYVAPDGSTTDDRARAATFYSYEGAAEFAKENGIAFSELVYPQIL
jgi:hypothetical protein